MELRHSFWTVGLVHCEAYMSVHCDIISNWLRHILPTVEVAKEDFLNGKHSLVYHMYLCNFLAVLCLWIHPRVVVVAHSSSSVNIFTDELMASALLCSTLSACTLVVQR